ncbi:hypothetical protein H310_14394 [Aphanomyces invadans]|uniref:Uncharacterized protein n=1 Tax=Aphanomyces invadans TaxID=157072 RepID=A0A024TC76_9STRA|nr:hypothetical protein H310_14394 [Aphanomyces invadans]ETV90907.1 hypothetical protein H310_14394 [Aphanomyces invadans]|eukprot:XP_008880472.1 hypothetical protein H310_14394 [Aphanomyces invadans]
MASEYDVESANASYTTARTEWRQECLDAGFDHHSNVNEKATSHFLRKHPALDVSITSVALGESTSTNPVVVALSPPDAPRPNMAVRAKVVDHVTKSLTVAQRTDLGRPIDSAELGAALQSMKPNTAPGPDGWPVAFFLTAPSTFAAILPEFSIISGPNSDAFSPSSA